MISSSAKTKKQAQEDVLSAVRGSVRVRATVMIVCGILLLGIFGLFFVFNKNLQSDFHLSVQPADIFTYVFILLIIIFISLLSLKEITKSKSKNVITQKSVTSERDSLEQRIAERTQELIKAEDEKMIALRKNAQFGELSQGLFHDLMSPLTSISLYIEQLNTGVNNSTDSENIIKKVVDVSKRMNSFQESVRRTLDSGPKQVEPLADLKQEIMIVRDIVAYKARMAGVELDISAFDSIKLKIHPIRLHQLLVNLVTNAIEACGTVGGKVSISVNKGSDNIKILISDNGHGMSSEQSKSVFNNSFTTKNDGHGIGLMTVKSIVENELHGTIDVKSELGVGTEFKVAVPN